MARRSQLLVALLVTALCVGFVWAERVRSRSARTLLTLLPDESFLVATVDVQALYASPLASPMEDLLAGSAEVATARDQCGLTLKESIHSVGFVVPEGPSRGDFGVALVGPIPVKRLSDCADKLGLGMQGGAARVELGGFSVVPGVGGGRTLAYVPPSGPLVLGPEALVRSMVDDTSPRARGMGTFAALEKALRGKDEGRKFALFAAALLQKSMRDRVRDELRMTLTADDDPATLEAVTDIRDVAVGVDFVQGETRIVASINCEKASSCAQAKTWLERKRFQLSQSLQVRLVGVGPLLDNLDASLEGASLRARTKIPSADLAAAIVRVRGFLGGRKPEWPRRPAPSSSPKE